MINITQKQKDLALEAKERPNERIESLYPIICQKEWVLQSLWKVLQNTGARTEGVDGKVKETYYDMSTKTPTSQGKELIEEICSELNENTYKPQPVRRIYIPKANGKLRPIGIPTIKDRVVQEAVRMIIEPIYESDFLKCSYGFRPNRNTMDAISNCYRMMNRRIKYYWVIEGDIKGCFDNIDHKILMKLIKNRIADRKLTDTIYKCLKAGYQEDNGQICKPNVGTPQGGIISPLLANIYLHEMDKWWIEKHYYTQYVRRTRRERGLANFYLIRYADDFIFISNGKKEEVIKFKKELLQFLNEMKLELSEEKTKITHAQDGFDFLGFHIRQFKGVKAVLIKPTKSNIQRIKDKVERILNRRKHEHAVINIIKTLNPVLRGWGNYYRYVNSKDTLHEIQLYTTQKFLKWYRGKYKMGIEQGTRKALEWIDKEKNLHIYQIGDETPIKRYIPRYKISENPYITGILNIEENPFSEGKWFGQSNRDGDLRVECFKRDKGVCQLCMGCKTNIEAHHIIPINENGEDTLENLITLCEPCHKKVTNEIGWKEFKRLVESRVR